MKLNEDSQTYFGIQFGGFFMTCITLPFEWKDSPFVYQWIGLCVTSYLRSLNVMKTLYLDDRFGVTKADKLQVDEGLIEGSTLAWILLELLRRLGYTFSFKKGCVGSFILKEVLWFLEDLIKPFFARGQEIRAHSITRSYLIMR